MSDVAAARDASTRLVDDASTGEDWQAIAENFVADLERTTRAVFVGEDSGGSPNLYGDATAVELPTAGLSVNVATKYWQRSSADDPRVTIEPDVRVPLGSTAFFRGRDPVLAAALAYRPR